MTAHGLGPAFMAEVDLELISDALLDARKSLGLTQTEVAYLAGIDQTTVSRIEAGTRMKAVSIAAYARAVGLVLQALPLDDNTHQSWWTTTDVATYLGVKLGTVSSYRVRGQMPEPDGRVCRSWVWLSSTIVAWRPPAGSTPQ